MTVTKFTDAITNKAEVENGKIIQLARKGFSIEKDRKISKVKCDNK